jgi:predicted transcriptional regulator
MSANVKEEAAKLVRDLPEQATWDDLMYEIYVRQKIEEGLKAADEGRVLSHEEVKRRFGLK